MPRILRAAILLGLLLFIGCGSEIRFIRNGPQARPCTSVSEVQVFFNPPQEKYESIGIMSWDFYQPGFHDPDITEAMPELKQKACEAGGNAIVVNSQTTDSLNSRILKIATEVIRLP